MFCNVCSVFTILTSLTNIVLSCNRSTPGTSSNPKEPLYLTPYIESRQYTEAHHLSKVTSVDGLNHCSYSGYITVNKAYNSNLFFWFFPAKNNPENAPVIMYLEGGPGDTSLRAIFLQGGPVTLDENWKLVDANVTWTEKYSVIYVDNPVGTGFSFTEKDEGYATGQEQIARDLYSFMLQFFQLFHQYSSNDLYIAGQSYGGKYVPAIGYKIYNENLHARQKINLKGIFVISGFSDPVSIFPYYAPLLFNIGMVSERERDIFAKVSDKIVNLIQEGKYKEAFQTNGELFFGTSDESVSTSYFYNFTGSYNSWNFLKISGNMLRTRVHTYIGRKNIRRALHVGNKPFMPHSDVFDHLQDDILKSVKPWVKVLMDNYKVMYLSGQLDILVNTPGTESFLMSVPWKGLDRYKNVAKVVWRVNPFDEPAGYVRQVDGFYQVVVRNAGHTIAEDQPERCYDLLQRFIEGRSFYL